MSDYTKASEEDEADHKTLALKIDGADETITEEVGGEVEADAAPHPIYDRQIEIAFGRNKSDKYWRNERSTFQAFGEKYLTDFQRGIKDGACMLSGAVVGSQRLKTSMTRNSLVLLDHDTGETMDEIEAAISKHGLFAVLWHTYSHLKPESDVGEVGLVNFLKKAPEFASQGYTAPDTDETVLVAQLKSYFLNAKGMKQHIVDSMHSPRRVHTENGMLYTIQHAPLDRLRSLFVLDEDFSFTAGLQRDRMTEWSERYVGFCVNKLRVNYDKSCTDPCRLMYLPRIARDADRSLYEIRVIDGRALTLDDMPRHNARNQTRGENNAFTSAARELGTSLESDDRKTFKTKNLRRFMAQGGASFAIAEWVRHVAPEDVRGTRGSHVTVCCPNDDNHSDAGNPNDQGFWVENAQERAEGEGFMASCSHNGCRGESHGDRAFYLDLLCQKYGIDDALELKDWCDDWKESDDEVREAQEQEAETSIDAAFAAFEDHVKQSKASVANIEAAEARASEFEDVIADQRRQLGKLESDLGKFDEKSDRAVRKAKSAARKRDEQHDTVAEAEEEVSAIDTALKAKPKKAEKEALEAKRVRAVSALERAKGAAARSNVEASDLEADAVAARDKAAAAQGEIDRLRANVSETEKEIETAKAAVAKAKSEAGALDSVSADSLRATLCKLIAGLGDGVAFDGHVKRLAAMRGEKETALRATIKAERKKQDEAREGQTTTDKNGLERDHNGKVLGNEANIRRVLDLMKVGVRFNEFTGMSEIEGLPNFGPLLSDAAMNRLRLRSEGEFGLKVPKDYFYDVVDDHARSFSYHPVRDYLYACQAKWDGMKRAEKWLVTYAGAEDTPLNNEMGLRHLIGAARRIRAPGTKHDESLIFESKQGENKSTFFETLAVNPEWFGDSMQFGQSAQKTIEDTVGVWIMEIPELSGMRGNEIEKVKAHMSRKKDKARAAYGRIPQVVPRAYVTVGSTNDDKYLKDMTGNRRFWPVLVAKLDIEALKRDLDQLWGEVATMEAQGVSNRLPSELWEAAAEAQNKRKVVNPFSDRADDLFRDVVGKITCRDVYDLFKLSAEPHQSTLQKVTEAMEEVGWIKKDVKIAGKTKKAFVREVAGEACPHWVSANSEGRAQLARDLTTEEPQGGLLGFGRA